MASLINISERAAIALHAVGALARKADSVLSTRDIALVENVSETHLAKVMRQLVNAGIVSSSVGPGGGFILARPAEEVTLLEVFELIDGPVANRDCILTPSRDDCSACLFKKMTDPVKEFVSKFLATITVADMAIPGPEVDAKLQSANLLKVPGIDLGPCSSLPKGDDRAK